MTLNKDFMGAMISWLCMVHCLAGPVLITLGISTAGLSLLENESVHLFLVAPILLFVAWSIPSGLRRHHHPIPAIAAIVGISLLFLGLFNEALELPLTVGASSMLIFAHLFNRKLIIGVRK